jgi:hypothetical protein
VSAMPGKAPELPKYLQRRAFQLVRKPNRLDPALKRLRVHLGETAAAAA